MVTPTLLEELKAAYKAWHDTRGTSVETWMALMANDVQMRSLADGKPGMEFTAPRTASTRCTRTSLRWPPNGR